MTERRAPNTREPEDPERRKPEEQAEPTGVRHDADLEGADRLPRLGNEEEKPFDDRFGE